MADSKKASEILRDTLGISPSEYNLMEFNARRYGMTDAEVEDAVLRQISGHDSTAAVMKNGTESLKRFVTSQLPVEHGKTKVFNAKNVLAAVNAPYDEKDGTYKSPEEKLVAIYRTNPQSVRNRVAMDKDFGEWGAHNLDKLVYAASQYKKEKPDIGMGTRVLGAIAFPRTLEAMTEGRKPGVKDYAGDIIENALMAVPIGAGVATKAARLSKIPKALANTGAAAIVPTLSETYDASVYSPEENFDRSVFQGADIGTGTLTNLFAPYMLERLGGRAMRIVNGKAVRDRAVEALPSGGSTKAKELVDGWMEQGKFKVPSLNEQQASNLELWKMDKLKKSGDPDFKLYSENSDAFRRGEINEANQKSWEEFNKIIDQTPDREKRASIAAGFVKGGSSFDEATREAYALEEDIVNELFRRIKESELPSKNPFVHLGQWAESFGVNRYGNNRNANAGLGMISGLGAFIDEDFDVKKMLDEHRNENKKEARDNFRSGIASQVLKAGVEPDSTRVDATLPQDSSDVKWLKAIADHPEIVRGDGEGASTEFKNWWNTRGVILLGKSGAFPGIKE